MLIKMYYYMIERVPKCTITTVENYIRKRVKKDMQPELRNFRKKEFIGKRMVMSFSDNKTFQLWQSFMPLLGKIENRIGSELYSVEVYSSSFFEDFSPENQFEKWAAIELSGYNKIPEGMESLTIPSGLYAVFLHKGPAGEGPKTYSYIFRQWLPASEYSLDGRPHFAVMGEKYKRDDPASEEELWIPVKKKRGNET
jgi:AraC family transcriptional regulator